MEINKKYKIDFEKIEANFKFKENSLTHCQGNQFKLLPYAANEKKLVSNFDNVVGGFSRLICNKELVNNFIAFDLIEDVLEFIGEFQGIGSEDMFKDIIESMFLNDDNNLIDFDIKTLNYISTTTIEMKIAKYLYSIFYDTNFDSLVKIQYDKDINNILYDLVLRALPPLEDKKHSIVEYKCYLPFIKELFFKDFEYILKNEKLYRKSIKRFLEYYYMFYVTQLIMKLSKFEKADLAKPDTLYFTLDWESTSKNRTAYQFGWEAIKNQANSLFSHAITLEFLNTHNLDKQQLGYVELYTLFISQDDADIENDIDKICDNYIAKRQDGVTWNNFHMKRSASGNRAFDKVYKLYELIEFQFDDSTRSRANKAYSNWYIKYVYENFAKKRGPLGYNLNLTEDDIFLMTKICIHDRDKIKLKSLFKEFEKRGMFFDRNSRIQIIKLYEKSNLLEKKSDSGDAQYVKAIL